MVKKMAHTPMHISPQVLETFQDYNWPGNIREMQNVIERALILTDGEEITNEHISLFNTRSVNESQSSLEENGHNISEQPHNNDQNNLSLDEYLVHFLKTHEHITETELAKQLGISRKTLWEKRNRLNIPKKAK